MLSEKALIRGEIAQVLLRPALYVNGVPASLSLLQETVLMIESTDRNGVTSFKEIRDLNLSVDQEYATEFQVPDELSNITFNLRGKVKSITAGQKIELSDSRGYTINGIELTDAVADVHLARLRMGMCCTCSARAASRAST